jgi:hypothetical protein
VLGLWNQSQQAIRQERNMLLIERLRTMGPGTTPAQANEPAQAAAAVGSGEDGRLPPPPPGEPWMEELATLPASSAPAADVLKVPVNSRITSPAPAATGSASIPGSSASSGGGGGNAPQLVGVVQVPGQSGSAIFQLGGSSTSAAVGESIGSSGWRLRSASGDTAVIEHQHQQRILNQTKISHQNSPHGIEISLVFVANRSDLHCLNYDPKPYTTDLLPQTGVPA